MNYTFARAGAVYVLSVANTFFRSCVSYEKEMFYIVKNIYSINKIVSFMMK